ncbi:MAG: hypothetical protein NC922_08630 [Candidatus Omnitrophica bacterium]|nr:hypothetical protein [Candidatus Omnitrophota bacterium]
MIYHLESIEKGIKKAKSKKEFEFYIAMKEILDGILNLHKRIINYFEKIEFDENSKRILNAYRKIPLSPPDNFFESVLAVNFIFYIDGCDSLERFDYIWYTYYERDKKLGKITKEEATMIIENLWKNFDDNNGWNVTIGGSDKNGLSSYNELTLICLEAIKRKRRPNLALKIRKDMPEEIFLKAIEVIETGNGLPALYNEELYIEGLKENHLNIYYKDIFDFAFVGCTETTIHGKSNIGSLDGGINLVGFLSEVIDKKLLICETFQDFLNEYKNVLKLEIEKMAYQINLYQEWRAKYLPQVIRSLFIDDCLESGIEFNNGGARYNWSIINVGGLANVSDSLYTIKKIIYEENYPKDRFIKALENNFYRNEDLFYRIKKLPKFGNDIYEVDEIAKEISDFVLMNCRNIRAGKEGSLSQVVYCFVTYVGAGIGIKATPDGRRNNEPIADSIGPHQGRDKSGPTAMLRSISKINYKKGIGSLVLNIRFSKTLFKNYNSKKAIINLIKTFFELSGMQLQINVVDQEVLKDAIKNPEKYENLIVRVGGYSEYFNRLSYDLKLSILEREEHNG